MKNYLKYFFLFFLFFKSSYSFANEIAYIDLNYIYNESIIGKNFNKDFNDKKKIINSEIEIFKKKIENENNDLVSKKNILSEEIYNEKYNKIQKSIKEFNLLIQNKDNNLKIMKSDFENILFSNLNIILEDFYSKNSLKLILKKSDILVADKELDITLKILDILDRKINN